MNYQHMPVLLKECIDILDVRPDGIYIDGTIGGAGHSAGIYSRLGNDGILIGLDRDPYALEVSRRHLGSIDAKAKLILVPSNFKYLKTVCDENGIREVDGIILDLGVSSFQLDDAGRGFSYQKDAPLDMRMDSRMATNAWNIVNDYTEEEIRKIIRDYGEEKWASRIASFITAARRKKSIDTTVELVDIIKAAIPQSARREGPHPAKRTFQALRIAVNDELNILEQAVEDSISVLKHGGRVCIITFHSLEDRIIKNTFRRLSGPCTCPPEFPVCICGKKASLRILTGKPVTASADEVDRNPRSRSAKLRAAVRL